MINLYSHKSISFSLCTEQIIAASLFLASILLFHFNTLITIQHTTHPLPHHSHHTTPFTTLITPLG